MVLSVVEDDEALLYQCAVVDCKCKLSVIVEWGVMIENQLQFIILINIYGIWTLGGASHGRYSYVLHNKSPFTKLHIWGVIQKLHS